MEVSFVGMRICSPLYTIAIFALPIALTGRVAAVNGRAEQVAASPARRPQGQGPAEGWGCCSGCGSRSDLRPPSAGPGSKLVAGTRALKGPPCSPEAFTRHRAWPIITPHEALALPTKRLDAAHRSQCSVRRWSPLSRRNFLRASLGNGGRLWIANPAGSCAAADGPNPRPDTAVIQIWLGGGPSHLDMVDLKPRRPSNTAEFSIPSTPTCPESRFASCCPGRPRGWIGWP